MASLICPVPAFSDRARSLIASLDAWEGHQTIERLKTVVEQVYHMSQCDGLHELVGSVPDRSLDPSSKKSLLNIISKVSRYREAARILYRMARRFPIARQILVVLVSLPEDMFQKPPAPPAPTTLASVLTRIRGGNAKVANKNAKSTIRQVCYLLKKTEEEANAIFIAQRNRTLKESKIHAEVQLIHYCDTLLVHPRPRVICSSKAACYLCNAFIISHGKFYMPKCHGRLYPGWRLQSQAEPSIAMGNFVTRLESQVQESIRLMLGQQKRTTYPDPNESTLLTIAYSDSTQHSSVSSSKTMMIHDNVQLLSAATIETVAPTQTERLVEEYASLEKGKDSYIKGLSSQCMLMQGTPVLGELKANSVARNHCASPIDLQVEYTVGPGGPLGGQNAETGLRYSLTLLTERDADQVLQTGIPRVVEGEKVLGEVSLDPRDLENLYITVGKTMLRFQQL